MSQESQETPQEYPFLESKEKEMSLFGVSASPEKKIHTSMSQELQEISESRKIKKMKVISKEEREEEERHRVSTDLTLSIEPNWTIKKKLTSSDIGYASRLFLTVGSVQHILKHLLPADLEKIAPGGPGMTVSVYDHDTSTTHELVRIKLGDHSHRGRWGEDFVNRRSLKEGDEIGLCWDRFNSKLRFRVLSRATAEAPAQENNLVDAQ